MGGHHLFGRDLAGLDGPGVSTADHCQIGVDSTRAPQIVRSHWSIGTPPAPTVFAPVVTSRGRGSIVLAQGRRQRARGGRAMAYAPTHRAFYDADSHIMELPDFLKKYADPALRDEIPEVSYAASLVTDEEVAVIVGQGSRHSAKHIAAQIALGDRPDRELQGDHGPGRLRPATTAPRRSTCWGSSRSSWCSPPTASPCRSRPRRRSRRSCAMARRGPTTATWPTSAARTRGCWAWRSSRWTSRRWPSPSWTRPWPRA